MIQVARLALLSLRDIEHGEAANQKGMYVGTDENNHGQHNIE